MDEAEKKRAALKLWVEVNGLNPNLIARRAGVSTSAIYNFLSGASKSLSAGVLEKLAMASGSTVDEILRGAKSSPLIAVTHRVGGGGRMFAVDEDETLTIKAPPGVSGNVAAALVDGDGLHPIPPGWAVIYEIDPTEPASLIGKVALVRWSGGGDRPVVRTLRKGAEPGTFTLQAFNGSVIEDVEVVAAHKVVSFAAP